MKTVNAGAIVTLDGSASSDPDGDQLTYAWTQITGPNVVLSPPANQPNNNPTTSFTAPNSAANLVFRLTVTDPAGLSDGDTVSIQVIPAPTPTPTPEPTPPPTTNVPPVANAGHEPAVKTVNAGATVILDGSRSYDPDGGTITSYKWSQVGVPTVALSGADTRLASFTAPNVATDTELVFRLIVTDNNNTPGSDEIHILVRHVPTQTGSPPTAVVGQDQVVNESQIVTLDGSQSHDPDGDALTYLWTQQNSGPLNVTLSDPTKAITTFRAPSNLDADATLFFQLKVTDKDGSDMAVQKVTVKRSTSPSVPPLPPDGRPQPEKGANQDPNTWRVVPMTDDPTMFKVVDDQGINVADMFTSQASAQQYIDHYKAIFVPGPGPGPGPGNGTTAEQIYTPLPGGRVFTQMNENGGQCKSDGIRFNLANEHTLVDRESTWIFTLNNNPETCTDKPWWSPKIGSHGSTGEGSGLYECSVPWSGGFKSCRTEGPHPQYHSCSGYQHGNVPAMPKGKPIGIKTASWRIPNGVHVEFWYDFTGGGKGPWIKYASLDDTGSGKCGITPVGANGEITGPAKAQDTMRMNGGDATFISGSIVELAPGQTPKGSIDTSASTSSLSSATDENSSAAGPHPIVKESLFNKGLNNGEKDAKEVATSDQKTMAASSTTTSDDVDCESPDNLRGQDSIDYCKGYEQGFTEQNNLMAEK
jgi:hypothetical protein